MKLDLGAAITEAFTEQAIDMLCQRLDSTEGETERKILQAEIFELVEKLNGNTIYLTVH